jgi:hypothetical protein
MAALRDSGCDCHPTITPEGPNQGDVLHEAGCALGSWWAMQNALGRRPMLVVNGPQECQR